MFIHTNLTFKYDNLLPQVNIGICRSAKLTREHSANNGTLDRCHKMAASSHVK